MEIRMGKIAAEKGQSVDVRSYGETLVKIWAHQDLNLEPSSYEPDALTN